MKPRLLQLILALLLVLLLAAGGVWLFKSSVKNDLGSSYTASFETPAEEKLQSTEDEAAEASAAAAQPDPQPQGAEFPPVPSASQLPQTEQGAESPDTAPEPAPEPIEE